MPQTAGKAVRLVFAGLGFLCVGVGVVGILVPGIPGTVFLLAASYLFVRSSPRWERWLREHPRLGPALRLAEGGVMPRRAKVAVLLLIWAGVLTALRFGAGSAAGRVVLVALALVGSAVILFRVRTASSVPPSGVS